VVFTPDQCVIDAREFYLRGRILMPVIGHQRFIWGVWARMNQQDFLQANEMWKVMGRESLPPYCGWLDTEIPIYGGTRNLEVRILTQPVGRRPHFQVLAKEHPLAIEQSAGISMQRVQEIAEWFLHRKAGS
jgi:hypothetical protein